jgi:hypothetical protein
VSKDPKHNDPQPTAPQPGQDRRWPPPVLDPVNRNIENDRLIEGLKLPTEKKRDRSEPSDCATEESS